jgi:hypothetical protein
MSPQTDLQAALQHRYRAVAGGENLPGVTTIIDVALDKGGMVYAAAEIAAKALLAKPQRRKAWIAEERASLCATRGNTAWARGKRDLGENGTDDDVLVHWARRQHRVEWDAKAARGSRIHAMVEAWARNEEAVVEPGDEGFADAVERYFAEQQPRTAVDDGVVLSEFVVANGDLRYGGRPDEVCLLPMLDPFLPFLVDYKTGSERPIDCALQAVGYLGARRVIFDAEGWIVDLVRLPELAGCRTVYFRDDGTYKVSDPFARIDRGLAAEAFTRCRYIHQFVKDAEKALSGEEA